MNNENIEKEFEELKNAYKDMFDNISIEQFKQVKEKVENERKTTAHNMFYKLGYKATNDYGSIIKYKRIKKTEKNYYNIKTIEFGLNFFTVYEVLVDEDNNIINDMIESTIFKEELQAINKQIEELRWK